MWGALVGANQPRLFLVPVGVAPVLSSSSVGLVDHDVVVGQFSEDIVSPVLGYGAGFTIEVNAVAATITSAVRQGDNSVVHWTIDELVSPLDSVTIAYNDVTGDIEDTGGTALASFPATAVTNQTGGALWFDDPDHSGHIRTVGL